MLAADAEGVEHVRGAEEHVDLLAEIAQLEGGAFAAGGDVEAGQGAEAHRVHADEFCEVQDDALVVGQERLDLRVENVTDTGHEFAVQLDDDGVGVAIDV